MRLTLEVSDACCIPSPVALDSPGSVQCRARPRSYRSPPCTGSSGWARCRATCSPCRPSGCRWWGSTRQSLLGWSRGTAGLPPAAPRWRRWRCPRHGGQSSWLPGDYARYAGTSPVGFGTRPKNNVKHTNIIIMQIKHANRTLFSPMNSQCFLLNISRTRFLKMSYWILISIKASILLYFY